MSKIKIIIVHSSPNDKAINKELWDAIRQYHIDNNLPEYGFYINKEENNG